MTKQHIELKSIYSALKLQVDINLTKLVYFDLMFEYFHYGSL